MKKEHLEELERIAYRPGVWPGFENINYCRFCHYAADRPHAKDCLLAERKPRKRKKCGMKGGA